MLEIKDLSILVGIRYLIKDLSLSLNKGDKLAIIGEEGNGKTTLLKAILKISDYTEVTGSVNFKNNTIGYLKQNLNPDELEQIVNDYLFKNNEDYFNKITELYKNLDKLKISDNLLEKKMKELSGGEKIKICILKLLLEKNDILFLDEPTNDLDIETLVWLENFINTSDNPIIYISHDETLLSNTANRILHLEMQRKKTTCKHTLIKTTYDDYVDNRIKEINKQNQIAFSEKKDFKKKQDKLKQITQKVEYQQNIISRSDPHGGKMLKRKMHNLKSQEKKLDNEIITDFADVEEHINFFFTNSNIPTKKDIIKLDIPKLKINNITLVTNIKLEIIGNKHVVIIGKNGVGKTTLLKHIYEILKTRTDINVGYMPQNYDEVLKDYKTPIDFLQNTFDKDELSKIRTFLGNMNFTKDEMITDITSLSGGTKAKLFLIKLVLRECNVLILDEPTRNVSPLSNPIIRKVLSDFKGTIISISHDRKYIKEVCEIIYELTPNKLQPKTELDF